MTPVPGAHGADRSGRRSETLTLALCFLVALVDGYDTLVPSMTATRLAPELGLSASEIGWMFGANTLGFFLGAMGGGWLSDIGGRKMVLMSCVAAFGIFSFAAGATHDGATFILLRFLSGLGLGGAQPIFIAIAAESGSPRSRATRVTAITAGLPLGGVLAAILLLGLGDGVEWRTLFYLGGWGPIALLVPLWLMLPPDRARIAKGGGQDAHHRIEERRQSVFRHGRTATTLWLWTAFFCTTTVLYLLLNWLPSLLVAKGYSSLEATQAALVFNLSGALAGSVGFLHDRFPGRRLPICLYCGLGAAMLALAVIPYSHSAALLASAAAGFFVIGAQLLLYGMAPMLYPLACRGAGVGFGIASGRVGAIVGPVMAGLLLAGGTNSSAVLGATSPLIAIALVAVVFVSQSPKLHSNQSPES